MKKAGWRNDPVTQNGLKYFLCGLGRGSPLGAGASGAWERGQRQVGGCWLCSLHPQLLTLAAPSIHLRCTGRIPRLEPESLEVVVENDHRHGGGSGGPAPTAPGGGGCELPWSQEEDSCWGHWSSSAPNAWPLLQNLLTPRATRVHRLQPSAKEKPCSTCGQHNSFTCAPRRLPPPSQLPSLTACPDPCLDPFAAQ